MQLKAGEYKLYTDVAIGSGPITSAVGGERMSAKVEAFPNPTTGKLFVRKAPRSTVRLTDVRGVPVPMEQIAEGEYDISGLSPAIYLLSSENSDGVRTTIKIVKTR